MPKPMNTLMQKEMSRKEFLGVVGFGVASLFGFGTLLKLMGFGDTVTNQAPVSSGFGSGPYGGAALR